MKGQKWDNVFLSILFQCHSTACTDTIPAHSLLSVYTVVSSLSLFLNLTLSYLCLLTIIWVCDVLFFWKIYFCRFVLSTFLIFNFFFLLPFVNGEFIHFSTPKTHLFPTWLQNPHLSSVHEISDLHILNVPCRVAKSRKWLKRLSTHMHDPE